MRASFLTRRHYFDGLGNFASAFNKRMHGGTERTILQSNDGNGPARHRERDGQFKESIGI